ncbi:MAG: hypothetical protein KH828_03885 [Clostridiales bacterium]|nr:hypothetical protein [Clostridiales bacterium]
MKIKSFLYITGTGILLAALAGCSKDKFDASAYATALLDAEYKGNFDEYAKLSGLDAEELASRYEETIANLVSLDAGDSTVAPGNETIPPQMHQDYTDLWKNVLKKTDYKVTETEKTSDTSYKISLETRQMNFHSLSGEILTEKLMEYYASSTIDPEADTEFSQLQFMLESYQEALEDLTYADPETVTLTLSKEENSSFTISDEELDTLLTNHLLDAKAAADESAVSNGQTPVTEATPDQTLPENLDEAPVSQLGEPFTLRKDGTDLATFSIDKIEATEERSEYDPSNPEKVIVITYTYQNLALESPLLYDEMSFQVLEGETVCTPYYLQNLIPADAAVKGGDAITASLAYGVSSTCTEVTVYINGVQIDVPFTVTAPIS